MDDPNPYASPAPESGPTTPLISPPEILLPPPQPESLGQKIFLGPDGLRAGWRFLLYLAMGGALILVLGSLTRYWRPYGSGRIWLGMVSELELLIAAMIPAVVMARVEKRPFDVYGLPRRSAFGKLFWIGAAWGFLALTVLILAMRGAGLFYFGGLALHGVRILKFAAYYALFFLLVGFFEEFLLRGYTQFTLTRGIGFWPAAIVLSVIFGAIHLANQGEAWMGALVAGLIGFFFCLTLRRTGDLWFAVGFHASWDWGETYLYSVPNSGTTAPGHLLSSSFHGPAWLTGGTVGPEGSVLVFGVILAMWVAFDRLYREVRYKT